MVASLNKTSVGDVTFGILDLHLPHENEMIRFFKQLIIQNRTLTKYYIETSLPSTYDTGQHLEEVHYL